MAKIDLSGNSGWQSKAGDKIKSLQDGSYDYNEIVLSTGKHKPAWFAAGLIIHIIEGELNLMHDGEQLEYEKGQIMYLNDENIIDLEIQVSAAATLGVFKEKAKK